MSNSRHYNLLMFALFLGLFSDAHAQQSASAKDLVSIIGFAEQAIDARDRCVESADRTNLEDQYRINPEMFGGLSPLSDRWAEVRENYVSYLRSMCDMVPPERMAQMAERLYAEALSEEDLKALLKFYEADVGRRYARASIAVSSKLNELVYSDKNPEMKKAWEEYARRLKAISEGSDRPATKEDGAINPIP